MIDATRTTKTLSYGGCTIERRELTERFYNRNRKSWQTRIKVRWAAYDADGNFIRTSDKGRSLGVAKRTIDRRNAKAN